MLLQLAFLTISSCAYKIDQCNYPLGMEDGRIEDQDITATDHHTESSAAHYSRLNSNKGAGAWCHSSVDRDDSEQYLQVKLNGLALVNLIALQRRHNGQESVPLVMVNASLDGTEWHTVDQIHGITEDEEIAHRPIEPVNARFIRLIPITDRKMPVCIRTEIFGCYRDDQLHHYTLSKSPKSSNPTKLNLANGDKNDFVSFEPTDDMLELEFEWEEPKNISQVGLRLNQQNQACLEGLSIIMSDTVFSFKGDCATQIGQVLVYLNMEMFTSEIKLQLAYTGTLKLAEIEWLQPDEVFEKQDHTSEMVFTDHVPIELTNGEIIGNQIFFVGSIIVVALILLFGTIVAICCSCKRFQKRTYSQASTTSRNGTWDFNLVPNNGSTANHEIRYVQNRSDKVLLHNVGFSKPVLPSTTSLPTFQPAVPLPPTPTNSHPYQPNKYEFGNEYSEIGSITADSGRGDSLNNFDEKHYAQVTY